MRNLILGSCRGCWLPGGLIGWGWRGWGGEVLVWGGDSWGVLIIGGTETGAEEDTEGGAEGGVSITVGGDWIRFEPCCGQLTSVLLLSESASKTCNVNKISSGMNRNSFTSNDMKGKKLKN